LIFKLLLDTNEWKFMRTIGDLVEPRRNAAFSIFGKYMIIHGGINSKG
jgi:hypothetical protein